ncbi:MAG: hypothetical protein ACN4ES_11845, partial [Cellulophaga baltica]
MKNGVVTIIILTFALFFSAIFFEVSRPERGNLVNSSDEFNITVQKITLHKGMVRLNDSIIVSGNIKPF